MRESRDDEIRAEILLPKRGETIAISGTPKVSSLFFDRIWGYSNDEVPREIRCFAGTKYEREFVKFRVFGMPVMQTMLQMQQDGKKKDLLTLGRMVVREMLFFHAMLQFGSTFQECLGDKDMRSNMSVAADVLTAVFYELFATLLRAEKAMHVTPVFPHRSVRNMQYQEGQRWTVQASLCNIGVVDENALSWAQVIEFRKDVEARRKYRRFLHWLDTNMIGKSLGYVKDEIANRLEDYEWALKKHGMKVKAGIIEETLDGKYLAGVSAAITSLSLAGHPTFGVLAGAGLVFGRAVVKLVEKHIDCADIKRGPNSEICWVYEVQRLQQKKPRRTS